jgi:hypothetical protein
MKPTRAMSIIGAAAMAACLTACSQLVTGATGLMTVDGHIVATIRTCDGVTATGIDLQPFQGRSFSGSSWKFDASKNEVVDLGTVDDFIKLLDDPRMTVNTSVSEGVGGWVHFTEDDIRDLDEGQIFTYLYSEDLAGLETGDRPYGALNQEEFDAELEDLCSLVTDE